MFKCVIIGEEDIIYGFRSIGAELINLNPGEMNENLFERLTEDKTIALIMITETVAKDSMQMIDRVRENGSAIVLLIPTHLQNFNISLKEIRHSIENAAGIDLFK